MDKKIVNEFKGQFQKIKLVHSDSFSYIGKEPWENEEWIRGEIKGEDSSKIKRYFGYDSNLCPSGDFAKRPQTDFNKKIIKRALEHTKGFSGDVYLDSFMIRKCGKPLFDEMSLTLTIPKDTKNTKSSNKGSTFNLKIIVDDKVASVMVRKSDEIAITGDVFKQVMRTLLYQWLSTRVGPERGFYGNIVNDSHFTKKWEYAVHSAILGKNEKCLSADEIYGVPVNQALKVLDKVFSVQIEE